MHEIAAPRCWPTTTKMGFSCASTTDEHKVVRKTDEGKVSFRGYGEAHVLHTQRQITQQSRVSLRYTSVGRLSENLWDGDPYR